MAFYIPVLYSKKELCKELFVLYYKIVPFHKICVKELYVISSYVLHILAAYSCGIYLLTLCIKAFRALKVSN